MDAHTINRTLTSDVEEWLALEKDVSVLRWDVYSRLQRESPFLDHGDTLFVSRYSDCRTILQDNRNFLNGYEVESDRVRNVAETLDPVRRDKYRAVIDHQLRWLTSSDGNKHTSLRSLATRVFSLRAIEEMRDRVQREVDIRLDELAGRDSIEIISEFAYQLPLTIISEMLDLDEEVSELIHEAWQCMVKMIGTPPERVPLVIDEVYDSMIKLEQGLKQTFAVRRREGTTDLLSRLLSAAADEGDTITEDDIVGVVAQLVIAGHQTTQDTIGNGLFLLLANRDQWHAICENAELVPNAVEEILRYHTPGQMAYRTARTDMVVNENRIAAGSHITCILGAANRDPEIFDDAKRFDIRRPNAKQQLAFGSGVHHCLGASLARLEATIFFATLARRFPNTELLDHDPKWLPNNFLHGLAQLHVRLR